ncbi:hypothetical protein H6G81_24650 [Scytonema hofmannii FACHB-248]|uniref:Transposase n=1 Tax=Scytonema hofmannii FACHB-248 TaxID=1842502 RepID=A0ABR8GWQ8_9CYAN|nr:MULTISPECIES: hypothetical protein [Nostocales]MBD2607627.1 hypothetical protein [Scytonema hofmannii FACHB-248]
MYLITKKDGAIAPGIVVILKDAVSLTRMVNLQKKQLRREDWLYNYKLS